MNFSGIPQKTVVGTLLRLLLRIIPANTVISILQGKLKGKKWIVGSGVHGCWLGSYEFPKQKLFCENIKPGMIIYDIGANVGFYTLLSSVLTGPDGKVIAFEPLPRNINYLKKHIQLNNCSNVELIEAAVSDIDGSVYFKEEPSFAQGFITKEGTLKVNAIKLDSLIEQSKYPAPDLLKIDIEGTEYKALSGALNLLKSKKPIIFLATHGREVNENCVDLLKKMSYSVIPLDNTDILSATELLAYHKDNTNREE